MAILTENPSIKKRERSHKVYCTEQYAQDLYETYCDYFEGKTFISKDFKNGQVVQSRITSISERDIEVELDGIGQTLYLDYAKEIRFFRSHDMEPELGMKVSVMITDAVKSIASADKAFIVMLKQDMIKSIKTNQIAYSATVKGVNEGGFIVDLNGLSCFMPGSLAAANKINDFASMLGKEIFVMVENYLEKSDMFVVSVKKYIKHILPVKIKEISYTDEYTGHVTGITSYGVFVEWDEIFTGLLHETEVGMDNWKDMKSGDPITFHIKEVRDNNRIILSQRGPNPEVVAYMAFKDEHEGGVFEEAEIKDIKPFGVFIKMGDVTGMMTPKEFRKYPRLKEGDIMDVHIKQVDPSTRKIYLRQPSPGIDDLKESFK